MEWWHKAAKQELPVAAYSLAELYAKGLGGEQSKYLAKQWYEKACKWKIAEACEKLRKTNAF